MTAAPGIVTSGTGPPNAVVQVQPGMNVQPVVLVDQNGQYLATSGSAATAGYLADLTGTVNVSAATAPTVGQVLTATGGSAATWQNAQSGFADPMTTGGDLIFESGAPAPARLAGNAGSAKTFLTSTGTGGTANAPVWGTITTTDVPFAALLSGAAFTGEVTVQTPVNASDAVTKAYADAIASGLSVKPSVQEATAAALPANVYSNGSSGVGATLTGVSTGVLTVDGILVALGDRVLVQDEAAAANNGIYSCTVAGALGVAYVLTRATDMNTAAQIPGAFVFTEQGTANAGAGFTVASEGPFVIGTTAINWTQFSGAGEITAGTGLSKTGNTIGLMIPVTVADGGTGGTTATFAFGNLSPMTTLGDMLFENSTPAAARLAGNTSATKMFLTQTGNGTVSAAPAWQALNDPLQTGFNCVYPAMTYWEPHPPAAGDAYYYRLLSAGYPMSNVVLQVANASGSISAGVYAASGSGASAVPGAQSQTSGAVACPSIGVAAVALGGTVTPPLTSWLAMSADNATATFQEAGNGIANSALLAGMAVYATTSHPLPSPAGTVITGPNVLYGLKGS